MGQGSAGPKRRGSEVGVEVEVGRLRERTEEKDLVNVSGVVGVGSGLGVGAAGVGAGTGLAEKGLTNPPAGAGADENGFAAPVENGFAPPSAGVPLPKSRSPVFWRGGEAGVGGGGLGAPLVGSAASLFFFSFSWL